MSNDGLASDQGAAAPPPGLGEREPSFRPAWVVLPVLIGTVLSLVASVLYTRRAANKLDQAAMSIATDASPAIEHLSAVREQILHITVVAADAVEGPADRGPIEAAEFTRSLALLHRELSAYRTLPFYPREEILYANVEQDIRLFEERLTSFAALVTAGDSRGASKALRTRLLPATTDADAGIAALTSFNAEQQNRLGIEIPIERGRAATVAFVLQFLTGLLGLALTGLVVLGTRRYTRLVQAQRNAADDHARRSAEFGSKLESIIGSCVDISAAITSAGDPLRVFQLIADEARTVVGARFAAVARGTGSKRVLIGVVAASGFTSRKESWKRTVVASGSRAHPGAEQLCGSRFLSRALKPAPPPRRRSETGRRRVQTESVLAQWRWTGYEA
jgi:hypothetical protein